MSKLFFSFQIFFLLQFYSPSYCPLPAGYSLCLRRFMSEKQEYFAHPTAVIDEGSAIGKGTKIWHFTHVMSGCVIGENCSFGQNVVVSAEVVLGKNVKVQNNVS